MGADFRHLLLNTLYAVTDKLYEHQQRIEPSLAEKEPSDRTFSGSYFLRTDRTELNKRQIWELYMMLKQMED